MVNVGILWPTEPSHAFILPGLDPVIRPRSKLEPAPVCLHHPSYRFPRFHLQLPVYSAYDVANSLGVESEQTLNLSASESHVDESGDLLLPFGQAGTKHRQYLGGFHVNHFNHLTPYGQTVYHLRKEKTGMLIYIGTSPAASFVDVFLSRPINWSDHGYWKDENGGQGMRRAWLRMFGITRLPRHASQDLMLVDMAIETVEEFLDPSFDALHIDV